MKEQQWRRVASSRRRKNDIALVRRQLALHSRIERALASRKDARARARMLLHALSCVCAPLMYALYKFDFHEETRWFVVARNLGCAVRTGREHRATTGRILFSYRRRRLVVLLASGFTSARGWHARKFDSYSISFNRSWTFRWFFDDGLDLPRLWNDTNTSGEHGAFGIIL